MSPPSIWVIVVGAGSGSRFGRPKQFEDLVAGERIIDRSIAVATTVGDGVTVVVPADLADGGPNWVAGGATRSESVRAGLARVPDGIDIICIHDAARPLADGALYRRVIDAVVDGADGAVPGVAVTDTIKQVDADGWVVRTPNRESLFAVQTPQAFRADVLRRAHAEGTDGSDDGVLVEAVGGRIRVVDGDQRALKITVPDDLARVRAMAEVPHG